MDYPHIFQPIRIGAKLAKNRIEIAPAAPFLTGHDHACSPAFYAYNRELAASGAGIVTLGVTSVDPSIAVGSRIMSIGNDLYLSDFNTLAELIHSYGALASAELVYSKYMLMPADKVVNNTSTEEVQAIINAFIEAAKRLVKSGFDIAFIHGGHGNVPAMFFNESINHRSDKYGGSFENRCRFAMEILQGIKEACGKELAVEYRLSAEEMLPGMTTLEETLAFAKTIEPYIDLLHISRGLLGEENLVHYIDAPLYLPRGLNLPFAERFKQELSVPVTVVGSFNLAMAEEAIAAGQVDMVSMIRTIYADNRCVEKARLDQAENIRPCIRCNTCIDRTHSHFLEVRCAVNPLVGRESQGVDRHAIGSKRVAIVGGGPAGMTMALLLSERGHQVTLFEREKRLGGLLRLAASSEQKRDVGAYLDWLIDQVQKNTSVELRLGIEASPTILKAEGFDAAVLAMGSAPNIPSFARGAAETATMANVVPSYWVGDVDGGNVEVGERVVVAGAGMTGLECALELAKQGKAVTVVERISSVGTGGTLISLRCLLQLLEEHGVRIIRKVNVEDVTEEGVLLQPDDGAAYVEPCNTLVYSFGFHLQEDLLEAFESEFTECYRIGDCSGRGGTVFGATHTAYDVATTRF